MNKFYENKAAMLILSLVLSFVLFIFVKTERYNANPLQLFQNVSEVSTETVSNVPVNIEGNVDQFYVTGLPETVTVKLTGPSNIVDRTLENQDFKVVTEDLSELKAGNHYIQLKMDNLSDSISYEISPSSVNITLDALQTKTFPVTVNVNNQEAIASGYELVQATTNPSEVTISGSQETIDKIANVSANISLPDNASENVTQKATINIEDEKGNILNANANPNEVEVTATIGQAGYDVPISLSTSGEQAGMTYNLENLGQASAKLIGISDSADTIEEVTGVIDVSEITSSTIVTVALTVPEGVQSISPQSIRVRVTPESEETVETSEENNNQEQNTRTSSATTESQTTSSREASSTSESRSQTENTTDTTTEEASNIIEESESSSNEEQPISSMLHLPIHFFHRIIA